MGQKRAAGVTVKVYWKGDKGPNWAFVVLARVPVAGDEIQIVQGPRPTSRGLGCYRVISVTLHQLLSPSSEGEMVATCEIRNQGR